MALTKVFNSMITGAVVNVLDYGENTIPGTTGEGASQVVKFSPLSGL